MKNWQIQIHGGPNESSFEISVINPNAESFFEAQRHYGWFNQNKLLISHNGGPCRWPVNDNVWKKLVKIAREVENELNGL